MTAKGKQSLPPVGGGALLDIGGQHTAYPQPVSEQDSHPAVLPPFRFGPATEAATHGTPPDRTGEMGRRYSASYKAFIRTNLALY